MIIQTAAARKCVKGILQNPNSALSKPETHVLNRLLNSFLANAESSASSFAPDGREKFCHKEVIPSALVEALSADVIHELANAGITFEKSTGRRSHSIRGNFPVVNS